MKTTFTAMSCIAMLTTVPPVLGHHAGTMFDQQTIVSLTGTVREFQFTNPHCYIQLIVTNDQGQDEEWSLELGAPTHLQRLGWQRNTLRAGDRISVTLHPLRDGSKGGEVQEATTVDGEPLGKRT